MIISILLGSLSIDLGSLQRAGKGSVQQQIQTIVLSQQDRLCIGWHKNILLRKCYEELDVAVDGA